LFVIGGEGVSTRLTTYLMTNNTMNKQKKQANQKLVLHISAMAVAVALTLAAVPAANAQQALVQVQIPTQPLGNALLQLGRQTALQIVYDPAIVQGVNAPAVHGTLVPEQALQQLLSGTGIVYARQGNTINLSKSGAQELSEVVVRSGANADGTTEGTGSYTGNVASTSTKLSLSLRETPQSVSVMTRQRMEDQGLTQLMDVVAQTPGLTASTSGNPGSDSSPIYSRGFQVSNYMVDGMGLVNSNYSSTFQTIDTAVFDRIEVVRGATGLLNGIGEAGGAINMIRKRPTKTFQASAKIEAGSWSHYRAEGDISTPINAAGTVRGRLVAAWENNRSYIDRYKEDKKVVYGVVEADLTPATLLTAGLMVQDHQGDAHARAGLPGFYDDGSRVYWKRSDSAASDWAYSKRRTESLFASLQHQLDNGWLIKGAINRTSVDYDELLGYATGGLVNKATGAGVIHYGSRWKSKPVQDSIDIYATGPFTLFGREHTLVFGATASQTKEDMNTYLSWQIDNIPNIYTWDGSSIVPAIPVTGELSRTEKVIGSYATVHLKPTDKLGILAGARVTTYNLSSQQLVYATNKTTPIELSTKSKVTPYLGVTYDISNNWTAYASYTSIFKPQNRESSENVFLPPLLGNSYEAGAKGAFFDEKLNLALAVFKVQQDNFAVALPTAPGNVTYYEALSGTQTKGYEVEVSGEVMRNWQASASFGRAYSQDRDGKRINYTVPQNNAKLYTSYKFPDIGQGLTIGGGVRWQSAIEQGPTLVRNFKQGSYAVVDLMARYALTKQMSLYVNVNNAFDKWYYSGLGATYYGTPRNFKAGLDIRF
jgi:outer membrane receptor for ferric coprogen and ferric-rhodotorulic acid